MMSNKWAFSLTSLITIFALFALASMPAAAFDVKFDAHDISYAGDIQLQGAATVEVYVNFGKVVTLAEVRKAFGITSADGSGGTAILSGGMIDVLNIHGAVIDVAENTVAITNRNVDSRLTDPANQIQAGKDYTITIGIPGTQRNDPPSKNADAYRLRLYLGAGTLTEADLNAGAKNSKGFHDKIFLVGAEPTTVAQRSPAPVSIALASGVLVPDAGFTGDTFDIIVTLK